MELLDFQAKSMKIDVRINFEDFSANDYMILTDKQRLQQVFLNLYSNALKFTSGGSVVVTVRRSFDFKERKDRLGISVRDTGTGISKSN